MHASDKKFFGIITRKDINYLLKKKKKSNKNIMGDKSRKKISQEVKHIQLTT